jgi:hypothetical protein
MYSTSEAFNIRCQEMQTSFFVGRSCLRSREEATQIFPEHLAREWIKSQQTAAVITGRSPTHTCKRTRSTHAKSLFFKTAKRCRRAHSTNLLLYSSIWSYLNGLIFEFFAPCDCEIQRGPQMSTRAHSRNPNPRRMDQIPNFWRTISAGIKFLNVPRIKQAELKLICHRHRVPILYYSIGTRVRARLLREKLGIRCW